MLRYTTGYIITPRYVVRISCGRSVRRAREALVIAAALGWALLCGIPAAAVDDALPSPSPSPDVPTLTASPSAAVTNAGSSAPPSEMPSSQILVSEVLESAAATPTEHEKSSVALPFTEVPFTDERAGITLVYPASMAPVSAPRPALIALRSSEGYPSFNILELPQGDEKFLDRSLNSIERELRKGYQAVGIPEVELLSLRRWTAKDGDRRVTAEIRYGNAPELLSSVTWAERPGTLFILTFIARSDDFERHRKAEGVVRESFRILGFRTAALPAALEAPPKEAVGWRVWISSVLSLVLALVVVGLIRRRGRAGS